MLDRFKRILAVSAIMAIALPVSANPVDMTGMSCVESTFYGTRTWEFYGDQAIRYYEDGSFASLPRIGEGAYERYNQLDEWVAVFYFFDTGDGVHVRLLARPGLIERQDNPIAPFKISIGPFNGECVPIWERE